MEQMSTNRERRRFERRVVVRPCKVRTAGSGRYAAAQTSDYSSGGALVCVGVEHAIAAGDQIEFGVAWHNEAILSDETLRTATVRRVVPMNEHQQAVGVEFAEADPEIVTRRASVA